MKGNEMLKMFEALQAQYPGYEVADVRFLAAQSDKSAPEIEELDDQFAVAIAAAEDIDWATISRS